MRRLADDRYVPDVTIDNLDAYLRAKGLAPADARITVGALSGGVSNVVLLAEWDGGSLVFKRSLPRLRVEAHWEFDPRRILVEREFMEVLSEILPGTAPEPVYLDHALLAVCMTRAPLGGVVWKEALLAGQVDPAVTERVAALLGALQRKTMGRDDLARRFDDQMPLLQGRLDPYHRTIARAHPDLRAGIESEVERVLRTRKVLVHGDFSPKNLIVYPSALWMLDFEVGHWGDPAFDPAFLLTHLCLKAFHRPERAPTFLAEARRFWSGYSDAAGDAVADENSVVTELGCLLLARIDGKSPVEYITSSSTRESVRDCARSILLRGDGSMDVPRALAHVDEALQREGVA